MLAPEQKESQGYNCLKANCFERRLLPALRFFVPCLSSCSIPETQAHEPNTRVAHDGTSCHRSSEVEALRSTYISKDSRFTMI